MIINSKNLYKLFVHHVHKCSDCIHYYKKNDNGSCTKFGNILYARTIDRNCAIEGKYFLPKLINEKK